MSINWYPGHMAKTRRLMLGDIKNIDMIVEVRDARIPESSKNPDLIELAAGKKARRWIVEVAHSWFNRFRKILVRFEKKKSSFEGLLQLAAAIIVFRKRGIIYG